MCDDWDVFCDIWTTGDLWGNIFQFDPWSFLPPVSGSPIIINFQAATPPWANNPLWSPLDAIKWLNPWTPNCLPAGVLGPPELDCVILQDKMNDKPVIEAAHLEYKHPKEYFAPLCDAMYIQANNGLSDNATIPGQSPAYDPANSIEHEHKIYQSTETWKNGTPPEQGGDQQVGSINVNSPSNAATGNAAAGAFWVMGVAAGRRGAVAKCADALYHSDNNIVTMPGPGH